MRNYYEHNILLKEYQVDCLFTMVFPLNHCYSRAHLIMYVRTAHTFFSEDISFKIFTERVIDCSFYRIRVRSLATLVSDSLTNCCLVDLIDVTLGCEDAYSILVEVDTVDAEKRVDESLVQTWKLKFGHKVIFCSEFQHKGGVQIFIIKMEI